MLRMQAEPITSLHWMRCAIFVGPTQRPGQRLILKHHAQYLEGSKAPDKEFKDFKNHVLHVRDNMWGGCAGEGAQLVWSSGDGAER